MKIKKQNLIEYYLLLTILISLVVFRYFFYSRNLTINDLDNIFTMMNLSFTHDNLLIIYIPLSIMFVFRNINIYRNEKIILRFNSLRKYIIFLLRKIIFRLIIFVVSLFLISFIEISLILKSYIDIYFILNYILYFLLFLVGICTFNLMFFILYFLFSDFIAYICIFFIIGLEYSLPRLFDNVFVLSIKMLPINIFKNNLFIYIFNCIFYVLTIIFILHIFYYVICNKDILRGNNEKS